MGDGGTVSGLKSSRSTNPGSVLVCSPIYKLGVTDTKKSIERWPVLAEAFASRSSSCLLGFA